MYYGIRRFAAQGLMYNGCSFKRSPDKAQLNHPGLELNSMFTELPTTDVETIPCLLDFGEVFQLLEVEIYSNVALHDPCLVTLGDRSLRCEGGVTKVLFSAKHAPKLYRFYSTVQDLKYRRDNPPNHAARNNILFSSQK